MNSLPRALLCLSSLVSAALAQDPRPSVPALPIATAPKPAAAGQGPVYDDKADARQDLGQALVRAKKDNKRV